MIKMQIFTVKDIKSETYTNPFVSPAVGSAVRGFQDELKNPDSAIGAHPDDYVLYHLGEYDTRTGIIVLNDAPLNLGSAAQNAPSQTEI